MSPRSCSSFLSSSVLHLTSVIIASSSPPPQNTSHRKRTFTEMMSSSTTNNNATSSPPTPGHKQLSMLLKLTESLLSNDESKRLKRENLCHRITRTILNNPKFSSFLHLPTTWTIEQRLNSVHCQLTHRCIHLLQHREHRIYVFAKSLLIQMTDCKASNDALTEIVVLSIFTLPAMVPPALFTFTNTQSPQEIESERDILGKVRAITTMMDRIYFIFQRRNSLKLRYQQKMSILEVQFNFMVFSMYSQPPNSTKTGTDPKKPWSSEPYKLPSLEIQCQLIRFWLKSVCFLFFCEWRHDQHVH